VLIWKTVNGCRIPYKWRIKMKKVYIKEEVCIGCHLCEVFCRLQHAPSTDLVKAFKKETPGPVPRLRVEEKGLISLSVRCQHCDEAPCIQACLTGALTRDPVSLLVTLDEERCIGCGTCLLVCPLGAIRLDTGERKALKCDLCQDEEIPACVANCPNEALVYVEA
jgi:carbon-monoxide dehydrogenase iron sulfur subunit